MKEEKGEVLNPADFTFETWTRQKGETALAYGAFCAFRDFGAERNIIKVILSIEGDEREARRKYRTWRNWSVANCWKKRAADYDKYIDNMRLAERRKMIEGREEAHRQITEKMLNIVNKKLDTMAAEELTQANVTDWVKTAVQTEREVLGVSKEDDGVKNGQPEIKFDSDFEGL
jgi:hypothetical protein